MIIIRETQHTQEKLSCNRFLHIHVFIISFLLLTSIPNTSFSQDDALEKAKVLNQQVIKVYEEGRYLEAIKMAEKDLAIREKILGPVHHLMATTQNNLKLLYAFK